MEDTQAVESAPVETGQAGGSEVGQGAEATTDSYEYIDVDGIGDKYVRVKVDGQELDVPVKEAISGYQRQADYTRKTQELAAQRESLQYASTLAEALQADPVGTLQILSQHYGAPVGANQQDEELEFMDPIERQVYELNQKVQSFEQMQARTELEQEIARLSSLYQDFNAPEVINLALRMGITDLEAAYKQVAYDRLAQEVAAIRGAQQVVNSREQEIVDAKRNASFVSGGVSANGATEPSGRITSVADAWLAAKRQMGM